MSTQNDLELTLRLIKDSMSREAEPNGAITDTIWMLTGTETVFDALDRAIEQLATLLSRIEWLEAEKHSWKTYAAGLNSRIDALSKDAERLDSGCIMTHERDDYGQEYKCQRNGLNLRAAIDAAISAREGE